MFNSETAGVEAAKKFLASQSVEPEKISMVARIIEGVSFKNELASKSSLVVFPELACVQDADRLDGELLSYC